MIVLSLIIVGTAGLLFSIAVSIAQKQSYVMKDEKVAALLKVLPYTNCGACGFATCSLYVQALLEKRAPPTGCSMGGIKTVHAIAQILNLDEMDYERQMAVIHCKGGVGESKIRSSYKGIPDCTAAVLVNNGFKTCVDGCLGLGSCVRACPFNAISISDNQVAVVDPELCTGCGRCIGVCPRNLIELIPKVHKIYLACNNHDYGTKVEKYCSVGCTSCMQCIRATPSGAITMRNNIPVLDYSKNEHFILATYKCPSKCFVDLVKVRPKAHIDTKCDGCGECIVACPVRSAITGTLYERHHIDKVKCIGCGMCLEICHAHAISLWGGLGYTADTRYKGKRI